MEISIDYMTEILSLKLYGTVCTHVIFSLSMLGVLRDNDAVVCIESNHVEMFCYFTNQVMSGLHLVYVGKGQQGSLEETMSISFTPSFGLRQQVVLEGSHATAYQQTTQVESGRDAGSYPRRSEAYLRKSTNPTTYCEAKRDEFLELKQGSLLVAEYERKYIELSRYAKGIVASERDMCRRFERRLRFEIRTPVTAIAKWKDFSQLVETALRVE
ncbi:uncharacterized protein E6C27_scaffold25G00130 [Cucumis melo var. makuwa]|uniref:Retrotransposon gag domain-containing protein n=1 Tax=Cucumis melo var. makuwa TaxID=1194695 RepID=A0A5A7VHB6_CUCMM|nr:uncharacterized protein E6C27_scaffold25G00130 [Cucumis melo var. makuwa]